MAARDGFALCLGEDARFCYQDARGRTFAAPTTVLASADMYVCTTQCPTTCATAPQEIALPYGVMLALSLAGCWQVRDNRGEVLVDAATCAFHVSGVDAEMSHPVGGGDRSSMIFLGLDDFAAMTAGEGQVPLSARVTGSMQVMHRQLLAHSRRGTDAMHLQELVVALVAEALAQQLPAQVAAGRPGTEAARRRLVDDARSLLATDPTIISVMSLATALSCSPHHLSRTFHHYTGRTLGRYRTELRVSTALEHLAQGADQDLSQLAAQCGFADHAHLTRTVRSITGHTPSALRAALLSPSGGSTPGGAVRS